MGKTTTGKRKKNSVKKIFAGDIFLNQFCKRQLGLLVLVVALVIVYISNRYASLQEQIEIKELREELLDMKYEALSRSSELSEKSRQSKIQTYIEQRGLELQTSTCPPVVIKK